MATRDEKLISVKTSMSRAPMKGNPKDKKGGQAASTPVVTHEIIAGKVTDHDWSQMIEKDEDEDLIVDIRDEIVEAAIMHIYCVYIDHQLFPYTISQAKDALLQIVEWRFLSHDQGEEDTPSNISWQPDEEPPPAITDCWAQGSVPKRVQETQKIPSPILEEPNAAYICEIDENEPKIIQDNIVSMEDVEMEKPRVVLETVTAQPCKTLFMQEHGETEVKEKKNRRHHYGPLRSAGVGNVSETLEKTEERLAEVEHEILRARQMRKIIPELVNMPSSCQSLVKVQQNRPVLERDVKYDDYGNVVSVAKLNPDRLPSHCVKVKYEVRDPIHDAKTRRVKAMTSGLYVGAVRPPKTDQFTPKLEITSTSRRTQVVTPTGLSGQGCKNNLTNLPSSLIENIELSPGVTVKEGNMLRRGPPRKHRSKAMMSEETLSVLRPVDTPNTWVKIDALDILDANSPSITHMTEPPMVPPIMARSPPQVS